MGNPSLRLSEVLWKESLCYKGISTYCIDVIDYSWLTQGRETRDLCDVKIVTVRAQPYWKLYLICGKIFVYFSIRLKLKSKQLFRELAHSSCDLNI